MKFLFRWMLRNFTKGRYLNYHKHGCKNLNTYPNIYSSLLTFTLFLKRIQQSSIIISQMNKRTRDLVIFATGKILNFASTKFRGIGTNLHFVDIKYRQTRNK